MPEQGPDSTEDTTTDKWRIRMKPTTVLTMIALGRSALYTQSAKDQLGDRLGFEWDSRGFWGNIV
jgi:hypothetical protein